MHSSSSILAWLGDVTLQATVVLALVWGVARLIPGISAAARHLVLAAGLAAMPVLMLCSSIAPGWLWSRPGDLAATGPLAPSIAFRTTVHLDAAAAEKDGQPLQSPGEGADAVAPSPVASSDPGPMISDHGLSLWTDVRDALPLIWLAGVAFGIAGLGYAGFFLGRLRRQCHRMEHPRTLSLFHTAFQEMGLQHLRVTLLCSPSPVMPMAWGWRRLWLVLPAEATAWSDERLGMVLHHELAHVQRGDTRSAPLAFVSVLLLWFHPIAWVVLRALGQAREAACDDLVLERGPQSAASYADELLQTVISLGAVPRQAAWIPALGMAMASRDSRQLQTRLAGILQEDQNRRPASWRMRTALLLGLCCLIPLLAGLSACRKGDALSKAGHEAEASSPAEAHTYLLTNKQWASLISGMRSPDSAGKDPFGPAPGAAAHIAEKVTAESDLNRTALHIRSLLLERGVTFSPPEAAEPLTLKDSRTLVAWADEANHGKIQAILAKFSTPQAVQLVGRVFTAPLSAKSIEQLGVRISADAKGEVTSILSEKEGRELVERMQGLAGFEVMSAPIVHATNGQRGLVEVVREFIYPTEFDPPQIPQQVTAEGKDAAKANGGMIPITPTTPTAFEMRPVGVRIPFTPYLEADDSITLEIAPEVTWFEGFVNYGVPIKGTVPGEGGRLEEVTLSENKIQQPIFFMAKHSATVTLSSGEWLLLGGFGLPSDVSSQGAAPSAPVAEPPDATKLPSVMESRKLLFFLLQASNLK